MIGGVRNLELVRRWMRQHRNLFSRVTRHVVPAREVFTVVPASTAYDFNLGDELTLLSLKLKGTAEVTQAPVSLIAPHAEEVTV